MSDLQAFNSLGTNLIQAVLVNQRSKLLQAQLARQQYVDQQRAAVEQAQAAKLGQELEMLKRQQVVARQLGQSMFDLSGGRQAMAMPSGPTAQGALQLQQADATRAAAELAGGSPSAAASLFTPRNVTQGSVGVDAFGRQIDNRRPVTLGLNQVALDPDSFAVQGKGYIGGSALGIKDANTGAQLMQPPARSSGADVANKQAENIALRSLASEEFEFLPPETQKMIRQLALQAVTRTLGTNAPVQPMPTGGTKIKSITPIP